jgi:hypothetical protein
MISLLRDFLYILCTVVFRSAPDYQFYKLQKSLNAVQMGSGAEFITNTPPTIKKYG